MSRQPNRSGYLDHARAAALGRRLCLGDGLIGLLGLTGWVTDVEWLTTLVPGQPRMMPNTAVALALAGLAGALDLHGGRRRLWRAMRQLAALAVTAIGIATLVEYGFNTDLGIDQLLFQTGAEPFPGRPSPLTAWALSCLGGAIILSNLRSAAPCASVRMAPGRRGVRRVRGRAGVMPVSRSRVSACLAVAPRAGG